MKLQILNIHKKFGNKVILSEFNAEFNDNTITCIMGRSGSGKTTLLNIIGLIEPYDSGNIYYDNKEIKTEKEKREMLSKNIGFIFQDFGLLENESVYDNFKLILNNFSIKKFKSRVDDSLEKVGLKEYGNRKVYELSGGEQQRVAIAKILFKNPDLILADEPTASIDEENKKEIVKLFKEMQSNGKTIIIVTHDKELASEFDRTILLG